MQKMADFRSSPPARQQEVDGLKRVKIEILFGSCKRGVWPAETGAQKKRFTLFDRFCHDLGSTARNDAIRSLLVGSLEPGPVVSMFPRTVRIVCFDDFFGRRPLTELANLYVPRTNPSLV